VSRRRAPDHDSDAGLAGVFFGEAALVRDR